MAKGLPYFKFTPTEWMTGDIAFESFELQGCFISICALYWQRDGNLSLEDLSKRIKNDDLISQLTDRFFSVNDGYISVKFLDEQFSERNHLSVTNSENGKKGGRPKALPPLEKKPTANRPQSEHKAKKSNIEEEDNKNKNNNKKENKKIIPSLIEFCDYVKLQIPNEYSQIEKSLKLKYEAWKINEWKDGYNTPIVNWKAKVLNTIQHLKKENSNGITNPNDRKIGRNTESEIKAFIEHGADLDAKMEFNRQNDFKS